MDESSEDKMLRVAQGQRDYLISLDAYYSLKAKGVNPPLYPSRPNYGSEGTGGGITETILGLGFFTGVGGTLGLGAWVVVCSIMGWHCWPMPY
jgi:hypothetical protein